MNRAAYNKVILLLFIVFGFAASDPLEEVLLRFDRYLAELPQEKIYLHLDRPYYTTGDTIWYKAYLVAGPDHIPSSLSNVIHLELINESNKVLQHQMLYAESGSAHAQLVLHDSLASGNYLIRAYTKWMMNFDDSYFFQKKIKVLDDSKLEASALDEQGLDLQFFPEGGELISGLVNNLAFKAIGPDGLGRKIKGKIVDESGNAIAQFESNTLGMGVCKITPLKNKKYYAKVDDYSTFPVPVSYERGLVMSVVNKANHEEILVQVQRTKDHEDKSYYLYAQTRGIVYYAAKFTLSHPVNIIRIPKSKFSTGVAQITLMDERGIPVSERLTYVDQKNTMHIVARPDKDKYEPRERITISVQATDGEGTPAVADLSISVVDDQQIFMEPNQENIMAYLLVSSELQGAIETPGYYFNPDNLNRYEDLDVLLMTQGWRRFIPQNEFPELSFQPETSLTIRGKLVDAFNNKPIKEGKVTLLRMYPEPEFRQVQSNDLGHFTIPGLLYFDKISAVLIGETSKGKKWVKIKLDSLYDFQESSFPMYPYPNTVADYERHLLKITADRKEIDAAYFTKNKIIVLDEVEIRGEVESERFAIMSAYGKGSVAMQVAGDPSMENQPHPLGLIQGRVAGVLVTGGGNSYSVQIRGVGSINGGTEPLIMIDDIPVPLEFLNSVSVRDIEKFVIWKGAEAAIFGSRGANGAIGFYTKRGGSVSSQTSEGFTQFFQKGFELPRQFYVPKYDVKRDSHIKPDIRSTLFWAPAIRTDSTGKATLSFYNHDLPTTVTGIVEGISITGNPGVTRFNYRIDDN